MRPEPYDWARDEGLDFREDPCAEPTTGDVKDAAYTAQVEDGGLSDREGWRDA